MKFTKDEFLDTQPRNSKSTEKISLDEVIDEILETPTLNGDSKQAARLSSKREERKPLGKESHV